MAIDPDVKRELDHRLARGTIGLQEYRQLLAEIGGEPRAAAPATQSRFGALVHQVDDLFLYERGLIVAGREKTFEDIARVSGGSTELSVNVVARTRRSSLSIAFRNGDSYYIDEDRAYLGTKRHEAIARAVSFLKQQSFPLRIRRFMRELADAGELKVGWETKNPFPDLLFGAVKAAANIVRGTPPRGSVYLSADGHLRSPVTRLRIRDCREKGVLELGVSRANFYSSGDVYAIETKPLMATEDRSRAIWFTVQHDAGEDVVMSVLDWFARGANEQHTD